MEFLVKIDIDEKKGAVLKKHVAAIHCSTALTLIQRKISNALLFHAFPNLEIEEEHSITISQICKIIGYNSYNYELIKNSLRALMTTLIEWNIINENHFSEDWAASTIISSVRLSENTCTYSYSPQIKKLLSNPSIYGQINLIIQAQFKSSYGLALYENCVRYKGLTSTKWLDYNLFRKLMGVEVSKYKTFRDFKKRVLERAVQEVNTYSEINVEYELRLEKRKVISIRFLITQKTKKKKLGSIPEKNSSKLRVKNELLMQKLTEEFFLSEQQSIDLMRKYDDCYLYEKIDMVRDSPAFNKGQINDLSAYFISAIKNNFQRSRNNIKLPKHEFFPDRHAQKEDVEKQKKQNYAEYTNKVTEQYYLSLDSSSQEELLNNFIEARKAMPGGEFLVGTYHKHGLKNLIIKTAFISYLKEFFGEEKLGIISEHNFESINQEEKAGK